MSAHSERRTVRAPTGWAGQTASMLGIGNLRPAPGTWASAATLPLAWTLALYGGPWALAGAALFVFAIGVWASDRVVRTLKVDDPSAIVIDEMAGQMLALVPAALVWQHYLAGFVLFRLFDIVKPWPASWADRELEGGFGVMADDMIAGAMAAALIALASWQGWL